MAKKLTFQQRKAARVAARKAGPKAVAVVARNAAHEYVWRRGELKNNQPFVYAGGALPIGRIPVQVNNISTTLITNIGGGSTASTREGNRCYLRSFHIRGHVYTTAVPPTAATGTVRVVVFIDRQPVIGTNALSGNVLDMSSGSAADMYGTQNWGNRKRFKIIHDRIINPKVLVSNIANNGGTFNLNIKRNFRKGGMQLAWQDATGTNIMGPHIYWFMMSSEADDTYRFVGSVRLQWKDI